MTNFLNKENRADLICQILTIIYTVCSLGCLICIFNGWPVATAIFSISLIILCLIMYYIIDMFHGGLAALNDIISYYIQENAKLKEEIEKLKNK